MAPLHTSGAGAASDDPSEWMRVRVEKLHECIEELMTEVETANADTATPPTGAREGDTSPSATARTSVGSTSPASAAAAAAAAAAPKEAAGAEAKRPVVVVSAAVAVAPSSSSRSHSPPGSPPQTLSFHTSTSTLLSLKAQLAERDDEIVLLRARVAELEQQAQQTRRPHPGASSQLPRSANSGRATGSRKRTHSTNLTEVERMKQSVDKTISKVNGVLKQVSDVERKQRRRDPAGAATATATDTPSHSSLLSGHPEALGSSLLELRRERVADLQAIDDCADGGGGGIYRPQTQTPTSQAGASSTAATSSAAKPRFTTPGKPMRVPSPKGHISSVRKGQKSPVPPISLTDLRAKSPRPGAPLTSRAAPSGGAASSSRASSSQQKPPKQPSLRVPMTARRSSPATPVAQRPAFTSGGRPLHNS
eukprot:Rhum_TRINITY_DN14420_c5_g1::Rhum_TRINITY_DN14420_c5_g1_i1::g.89453::m.89453